MPSAHDANDERVVLDLLVRGFQLSRMLRLVADLGVADRIAPDERLIIDALAVDCGVQTQPLNRVLRAVAAFGVFSVSADGEIGHTRVSGRRRGRGAPGKSSTKPWVAECRMRLGGK
jgi:hypothetical protein